MAMAEKIRYLLIATNMQNKELAVKLGTTSSNISGKLKRDNFSEKELQDIAEACDAVFEGTFKLKDGRII